MIEKAFAQSMLLATVLAALFCWGIIELTIWLAKHLSN